AGIESAPATRAVAAREAVELIPQKEVLDPETLGIESAAQVFEDAYGPDPAARSPVVVDTTPLSKRKLKPSAQGDKPKA
ncbi:MAG: hypothetical protein IID40_07190, partial [Planctomycetes bacterium]|nr:hypothetical protein [Planctomycetota bacterium]